jgi:hypothetical protein
MNKTFLPIFAAIMALFYFSACEVESALDVNQDRIYTDFEVFYNSNSDKTWVVAQFRFGGPTGTILELGEPAFVEFNGEELPYNALFSGYFKEFAGQLNAGTFKYTDADGITYENSIPAYEGIGFPASLDTIRKSQALDIVWEGSSLAPDQAVGLFIGSWQWGNDALALQINEGANNIVLGINQMANLATGISTCFMDRRTEKEVSQGTSVGGKIRGKYRATNVQVTVVE